MINKINLINFRNHSNFNLSLDKTTILIGSNGAGKTNILEAISLVSFGRSFREDDRKNLITLGCDYGRVNIDEIEFFISKSPRLSCSVKLRGLKKSLTAIIGQIPSVVFSPETLAVITGEPSLRRRFFDIMISQISKDYLKALSSYLKIRRQRNRLLDFIKEGRAEEKELDFWDAELSGYGNIIASHRTESAEFINKIIDKIYQEISGDSSSKFQIEYQNKSGENLFKKLTENRSREIGAGVTIYGPHRDDIIFKLNNHDIASFGSRGEIRSATLSLKIAELEYLNQKRQELPELFDRSVKPILLLDDVFSEFDADRRSHLGSLISSYQSLITTTDLDHLNEKLKKNAKIIEITKRKKDG